MGKFKSTNLPLIIFFAVLAVVFTVAFIFSTVVPYFQMKTYFEKLHTGQFVQILNTDSIFSPYTYVQGLIRPDLLNHFSLANMNNVNNHSFDKAIAYQEDLLKQEGFNPYNYIFLATAYSTKGKLLHDQVSFEKAETYFKNAISISPTRQELYYSYGVFLSDQGRSAEAQEIYQQALNLGNQAIFSHFYLGLALITAGENNYIQALDHLETFFTSPYAHEDENYNQNADPGWTTSKNDYNKLLRYFYQKKDKDRVLIIAKRLSDLDQAQSQAYNQVIQIINQTGQLPVIDFEQ